MTGGGKSRRKASSASSAPLVQAIPCEQLTLTLQLTSPKPAVVATLRVRDVLDVGLASAKGRNVVEVFKDGQTAGGLPSAEVGALRDCILRNHKYKATVLDIDEVQLQVYIQHV